MSDREQKIQRLKLLIHQSMDNADVDDAIQLLDEITQKGQLILNRFKNIFLLPIYLIIIIGAGIVIIWHEEVEYYKKKMRQETTEINQDKT